MSKTKEDFFDKAIEWAEKKSNEALKANTEGFEKPSPLTSKNSELEIYPDITFRTKGGARHYTEIAIKQDNTRALVTRWKLLSTMADIKRGKFHILAPRGHKMFAQKLIDDYKINAQLHSL